MSKTAWLLVRSFPFFNVLKHVCWWKPTVPISRTWNPLFSKSETIDITFRKILKENITTKLEVYLPMEYGCPQLWKKTTQQLNFYQEQQLSCFIQVEGDGNSGVKQIVVWDCWKNKQKKTKFKSESWEKEKLERGPCRIYIARGISSSCWAVL